jgi:hypothetical protein
MKLFEEKDSKSVQLNKASEFCQLCNSSQFNSPIDQKSNEICKKCGNKASFTSALVQVNPS